MDSIHSSPSSHSHAELVPPIAVYSFVHGVVVQQAAPSHILGLQDPFANSDTNTWTRLVGGPVSAADALDSIVLSFLAFNSSYSITLTRKTDLLADASNWLEIDGRPASPTQLPLVYEGFVTGHKEDSSARMIMHTYEGGHNIFEGSFTTPDEGLYNLKSVQTYSRSRRPEDIEIASALSRGEMTRDSKMILFHDSGIEPPFLRRDTTRRGPQRRLSSPTSQCATDHTHPQYLDAFAGRNPLTVKARDLQSQSKITRRAGSTGVAGCRGTKQFLFIGVAADCNYVAALGSTTAALTQILNDFNQASLTYDAAFQVSLAVIKVNLQSSCSAVSDIGTNGASMAWNQGCVNSYSINNRLSDFSHWRGSKDGNTPDDAGLWHLMTGCTTAVSGQAVGIAWLETICQKDANTQGNAQGGLDYVSGTGVSSIVPVEWKVVAHEVGHNFGAIHDCTSSACPQAAGSSVCCPCSPNCDCAGQFLMHPTDNAISSNFSTCSSNYICTTLQKPERYSCLQPPGALKALTTNICGNGVKEAGEECDCGGPDCGSTDPCCDGATCKLTTGSVCDDFNDDCCTKCQFKPQGVVCRPSAGVCDYAEVCDGKSGMCPTNLFAPNGQNCDAGNGLQGTTCANGVCTSRDAQCSTNANGLQTTGVCSMPGSNTQCNLLCQSTSGVCYILAGSMIDGTPCGYAGTCLKGYCEESSWFGKFVDLFMSNLQLSVPIAVAVGLLLLGSIWSLCGCCYRQYKYGSAKKRREYRPSPAALPVIPLPPVDIPLEQRYQNPNVPAYQPQQQQSLRNEQYRGSSQTVFLPTDNGSQSSVRGAGQNSVRGTSGSQNSVRGAAGSQNSVRGQQAAQSNWVDASKYNGNI
ncbi:hypothetical protein BCR33DRAFT_713468 [Rhizoclosmatium globosum]|uniref:Disintegrin and metalloproteinase domain-containing protein B n=1 Tax=Rhizoclosmatium globosum TaxID=329046 RepID=A0A1Y2CS76_9FUNG|nr:hypothetical protein BCR33DRAFT_713468 [Rhizoclosmatium globosum]|eukprot:ORY49862.1 hypothetical protein BCR33DRAFT_713468 [Rhizoclosmatium globosum]